MKYSVKILVFVLCCIIIKLDGSPFEKSVARSRIRRIVNGEKSYIPMYPSQIELYYNGEFICGGTIIGKEWILTAAHCVDRGTNENYHLYSGSSYLQKLTKHKVENITRHEKYNLRKLIYDIAVCKVSPEFEYSVYVQPAALPEAGAEIPEFTTIRVAGHGRTETKEESNILIESSMFACDTEECDNAYPTVDIGETHLCVCYEKDVKGFCKGDSGGPGMLGNNTIVGIVSFLYTPCGRKDRPQVMANVPNLRDWIKTKTGL